MFQFQGDDCGINDFQSSNNSDTRFAVRQTGEEFRSEAPPDCRIVVCGTDGTVPATITTTVAPTTTATTTTTTTTAPTPAPTAAAPQSRYNREFLGPIFDMDFQFWAIWAAKGSMVIRVVKFSSGGYKIRNY